MLSIKENKTLEGATAKTLCCKCKQVSCHGQHCFILSQSCRNSSFIVLSASWGISLSHQWYFQVELILLQHLWGQPTAVEVSLMLGKDQVSILFQTRNGFCAPICHREKVKHKTTAWKLLELVNEVAPICFLSWWFLADWQNKLQQAKRRQSLAPNRNIQLSKNWKMLRLWLVSSELSTLGRFAADVITAEGPLFFT